jgi:hypothetical protein
VSGGNQKPQNLPDLDLCANYFFFIFLPEKKIIYFFNKEKQNINEKT